VIEPVVVPVGDAALRADLADLTVPTPPALSSCSRTAPEAAG
jgi:hypothetical protein